jgi:hypothetical protein
MMKIFFQGIFWYNWLQETGSKQIMEANIMACDSCANFLVVFVQDEQPDVQGLAVTLVSGRSTTESAVDFEDVSAYQLSLVEDTNAVTQLV